MKVLIVEDDPLHRSYLHEAVNAALPECDTVIEAENGTVGEKLARDHKSAHIVMDLQMANRNGIEAARTIWKERPETRILFWSNYSDEAYVRGVSRIVPDGAAYGYVLKSASDERLKLALRSIFIESQCVIDREVRGLQQKEPRPDERLYRFRIRDPCRYRARPHRPGHRQTSGPFPAQRAEPPAAALRQARRLPERRRRPRGRPLQFARPRRHRRFPAQTPELQRSGAG